MSGGVTNSTTSSRGTQAGADTSHFPHFRKLISKVSSFGSYPLFKRLRSLNRCSANASSDDGQSISSTSSKATGDNRFSTNASYPSGEAERVACYDSLIEPCSIDKNSLARQDLNKLLELMGMKLEYDQTGPVKIEIVKTLKNKVLTCDQEQQSFKRSKDKTGPNSWVQNKENCEDGIHYAKQKLNALWQQITGKELGLHSGLKTNQASLKKEIEARIRERINSIPIPELSINANASAYDKLNQVYEFLQLQDIPPESKLYGIPCFSGGFEERHLTSFTLQCLPPSIPESKKIPYETHKNATKNWLKKSFKEYYGEELADLDKLEELTAENTLAVLKNNFAAIEAEQASDESSKLTSLATQSLTESEAISAEKTTSTLNVNSSIGELRAFAEQALSDKSLTENHFLNLIEQDNGEKHFAWSAVIGLQAFHAVDKLVQKLRQEDKSVPVEIYNALEKPTPQAISDFLNNPLFQQRKRSIRRKQ